MKDFNSLQLFETNIDSPTKVTIDDAYALNNFKNHLKEKYTQVIFAAGPKTLAKAITWALELEKSYNSSYNQQNNNRRNTTFDNDNSYNPSNSRNNSVKNNNNNANYSNNPNSSRKYRNNYNNYSY